MGGAYIRGFEFAAERYQWDCDRCTYAKGWAQMTTYQDASYFGIWVNPTECQIFTFCEGDTSLYVGDSDADFRAELVRCLQAYSPDDARRALIDVKFLDVHSPIRDAFVALGLADALH